MKWLIEEERAEPEKGGNSNMHARDTVTRAVLANRAYAGVALEGEKGW